MRKIALSLLTAIVLGSAIVSAAPASAQIFGVPIPIPVPPIPLPVPVPVPGQVIQIPVPLPVPGF